VFRNPVGEFRLTGARSGPGPTPLFKPALEALEERIVLSGATVPLTARAQALAAVNPAVATQQVLNTCATSLSQYESLQTRLVALASQMGTHPAGTARQPFVLQAQNLVKGFLKKENRRFHQFQLLAKRVAGSELFTTTAGMYRSLHGSFSLINRQVTLFRWLGYTTLTAVSTTTTAGRSARPLPTPKEAAWQAQTRVTRTAVNMGDADLVLLRLTLFFDDMVATIPPVPSTLDSCSFEAYKESLEERETPLVVLGFIGILLSDSASPDAVAFFKAEVRAALDRFDAARMKAADAAFSSSTMVPPHVPLPEPPPPLPPPIFPPV
jgi:hypothetical protein